MDGSLQVCHQFQLWHPTNHLSRRSLKKCIFTICRFSCSSCFSSPSPAAAWKPWKPSDGTASRSQVPPQNTEVGIVSIARLWPVDRLLLIWPSVGNRHFLIDFNWMYSPVVCHSQNSRFEYCQAVQKSDPWPAQDKTQAVRRVGTDIATYRGCHHWQAQLSGQSTRDGEFERCPSLSKSSRLKLHSLLHASTGFRPRRAIHPGFLLTHILKHRIVI